MDDENNIVQLSTRTADQPVDEDRVVAAIRRLERQAVRQVNWPAVISFATLSIVSFTGAALVPGTPEGGVKWGAAIALTIGSMSAGLATLHRHVQTFWALRHPKS
jgi:hypothetical protein